MLFEFPVPQTHSSLFRNLYVPLRTFLISHEQIRLYIKRKEYYTIRTEFQNTQKKDTDKKIAEQGKQNIKIKCIMLMM